MASKQHFHTLEEAMEIYDEIIKIDSDRGDGVDVRVMKFTKDNDSWKETCVAQMKDEGRDFWSDEE